MGTFNKIARKGSKLYKRSTLLLTAIMLATASATASAEGLGQIFKRLTGLGQDTINMIQMFGIAMGVVSVVGGLLGFIADAKTEGNGPIKKKTAAIMVAVGCVLTAISSVLTTGSDTVWGDGGADRGKITIPQ